MTQKEIGIGIIGYGIGRVHAYAWKNLPLFYDDIETLPKLAAAFSARDTIKTSEMARDFGFTNTYSDWRKPIEKYNVNIVDDCTSR